VRAGGQIISLILADGKRYNARGRNLILLPEGTGYVPSENAEGTGHVTRSSVDGTWTSVVASKVKVLKVGERIELCGLEGESETMNGTKGIVEMIRAGGQIVTVHLDSGRRFNTRGRNLTILDDDTVTQDIHS
jgi:hypothetical protein